MYGVFGARKSPGTVLLLQLLWVALVTAGGVASAVFAEWNLDRAAQFALPYAIAGIVSALAAVVAARISGPSEIQDTIWECIDIRGAALES
jgi:hypothetical protein